MKFCDKCGSFMQETIKGFSCPRCGNEIMSQTVQVRRLERTGCRTIDIIDPSKVEYAKVKETCPRCGNPEAFRGISFVSGEHAGVRQERSVEHLKCTKCQHTWSRA